MSLTIKKRNGEIEKFHIDKIFTAVEKAYRSVNKQIPRSKLGAVGENIRKQAKEYNDRGENLGVEDIQDLVELALIDLQEHEVLKSFILYRNRHAQLRHTLQDFSQMIKDPGLMDVFQGIQRDYREDFYNLQRLYYRMKSFYKPDMDDEEVVKSIITSSIELTSREAPNWEYIAARFLNYQLEKEINAREALCLYDKIQKYADLNIYGSYMKEYGREEVEELEAYLKEERSHLLTYSALDLLAKRYLLTTFDGHVIEKPQEMFMGIAMHLALKEKERVYWAKKIYDILSQLKATVATPTMSNARRPHHQLSSCFIDTVDDSLIGIYKSIDNFAHVSKSGGGMGLYFGKVRANGSDIRGYKGVAGGVIRWIKLANDTAVAVDQLGVRQGAVAVYLDVWHRDLPEFLQLKTNSGDDRSKAHDVFPGICYPDLFWRLADENIDSDWYMMCPHEIRTHRGYNLEDYYGKEWEEKYLECVRDPRIPKRTMKVKDIVRMVIKSATETGTPFTFNRDAVNEANPNKHQGIIYSSNLCTEIAQNMSPIRDIKRETRMVDGEEVVVETSKPGDFVVCNLASLVLGNLDVDNEEEMRETVGVMVRALDNVIDLNFYPLEYAKITNSRFRAIGLGVSGYHHMLANKGIEWESQAHLQLADEVFEKINYYAIETSSALGKEKGSYKYFQGSDWENGKYFEHRGYTDEKWRKLKETVAKDGMRNGYLLAVAPTGSTSIIAGTTAGIDPVMNLYFLEEKKGAIVPRVAPNLNPETFWIYKSAHEIDQNWSLQANGVRQRHIDQAQSFNLYITTEHSMRDILEYYTLAWKLGVKSVYYVRSKSLEVEACESCYA